MLAAWRFLSRDVSCVWVIPILCKLPPDEARILKYANGASVPWKTPEFLTSRVFDMFLTCFWHVNNSKAIRGCQKLVKNPKYIVDHPGNSKQIEIIYWSFIPATLTGRSRLENNKRRAGKYEDSLNFVLPLFDNGLLPKCQEHGWLLTEARNFTLSSFRLPYTPGKPEI